MLISCSSCGRIHERAYKCEGKQRTYQKKLTIADKFRKTQAWKNKRGDIVSRDRALCQLCIRDMYPLGTTRILNQDIQVHHIEPINKAYDKRLEDSNLISLCTYHHYMADNKQISMKILKEIVIEQECQQET